MNSLKEHKAYQHLTKYSLVLLTFAGAYLVYHGFTGVLSAPINKGISKPVANDFKNNTIELASYQKLLAAANTENDFLKTENQKNKYSYSQIIGNYQTLLASCQNTDALLPTFSGLPNGVNQKGFDELIRSNDSLKKDYAELQHHLKTVTENYSSLLQSCQLFRDSQRIEYDKTTTNFYIIQAELKKYIDELKNQLDSCKKRSTINKAILNPK